MGCNHPLRGWYVGFNPSGKRKVIVTPYDTVSYFYDNKLFVQDEDSFLVPCGRCIGCRLSKSKEWAQRCMLELKYHESAYFITLTYDDEHLPKNNWTDPVTGETDIQSPVHTLRLEDIKKFHKRLRKNTGQKLRVFYCGEYGSQSFRPHYHTIVFGLKLDDLEIYKQNFRGDILYNSPTVEKCWRDDQRNLIGHVVIAEVNWETCAYVARYTVKKNMSEYDSDFWKMLNCERPFVHMSNKPGIAYQYFEEHHEDIYKYDKIFMSTSSGGKVLRPAKYFDKKFDLLYPSDMAEIKEKRAQIADYTKRLKEKETGLDYLTILAKDEEILMNKLGKVLERSEI